MDRVTLLSCRTQAFLMALSSTSLSEPCYTFIHSWLLSMVWLVGLVLAKLQTGRLKIALFEAMFFRNKITINDDSVWVTHVDAHGKGLFSDETAWNEGTNGGFSTQMPPLLLNSPLHAPDTATHSTSETWHNVKDSWFLRFQRVPLPDLWLLPKVDPWVLQWGDCVTQGIAPAVPKRLIIFVRPLNLSELSVVPHCCWCVFRVQC